jgi:chemotaxis protein CheD
VKSDGGRPPGEEEVGSRLSVYLHPGQVYFSSEPAAVTTILGSCVAVCLWDPVLQVGGMNHYLLPHWAEGSAASLRYGNVAIRSLIEGLLSLGCAKERLVAKLFGGACVIHAFREGSHLGIKNVQVARLFLAEAGIRVAGEDVGGRHGRKLIFQTDNGVVWMKSL